jgi:hypothetical protein
MKLKTILDAIHESADTSTPDELACACKRIIRAQEMSGGEIDTLHAAFMSGPLHDGDVPSKSCRDTLLSEGFIAKVIVKGNDGFNACTYSGSVLYRILESLSEK